MENINEQKTARRKNKRLVDNLKVSQNKKKDDDDDPDDIYYIKWDLINIFILLVYSTYFISKVLKKIILSLYLLENWRFKLPLSCEHWNDFEPHINHNWWILRRWPSATHFVLDQFLIIFQWNSQEFVKTRTPSTIVQRLKGLPEISFQVNLRRIVNKHNVAGVFVIVCFINPSDQVHCGFLSIIVDILKNSVFTLGLINFLLSYLHGVLSRLFRSTHCTHFCC